MEDVKDMPEKDTETAHSSIDEAFLVAQPNFTEPAKDGENIHFKNRYATLRSTLAAVKPHLNAEGVSISQPMINTETGSYIRTIFRHVASKTTMEGEVPLLGGVDMQKLKSASTYARRIGLENLAGLAPGDEDDDDADETREGKNPMGASLKDAWNQGVLDALPENASPLDKANAFAAAVCKDFEGKKEKALRNRWDKHKGLVASFEKRFPKLHAMVIDAYENAMIDATDSRSDRLPID